jgi:hypothetical protein
VAGDMDYEGVPLETVRDHYELWRWRLERETSMRLVDAWVRVGASSLHAGTKERLMHVAWALASFERAFTVLDEDAHRAQVIRKNQEAPAPMAVLSGPYAQSLDYLLTMGLWMDLGEVLIAYRTICDRFGHLREPVRKSRLGVSARDLEDEITTLEDRRLPSLSGTSIRDLATTILHHAWHPTRGNGLEIEIAWKGSADEPIIDFASGDVRGELVALVEETSAQVNGFLLSAIP